MTVTNELPYRLNLQFFADDNLSGEEDLLAAIRGLKDSELKGDSDDDLDDDTDDDDLDDDSDDDLDDTDDSDDDLDDTDDDDDLDDTDDDDDLDDDDLEDDELEDEEPQDKKKQSKEDNARFAKERREREAKERAERELERLKQESPEFKLAKQLSEIYGQPPEVIIEQLREEQLKREAEQRKVPIEELREKRAEKERADRLEQEIAMLKYNQWETQIQVEGERLRAEYPMLSYDDLDTAVDYILNTAKNVELPLEDAIFAVHGKKIIQAMAKNKVQDDLANQSGRKRKTPLAPNNGKGKTVVTLSSDEQLVARAFGMTDEEYIKYK